MAGLVLGARRFKFHQMYFCLHPYRWTNLVRCRTELEKFSTNTSFSMQSKVLSSGRARVRSAGSVWLAWCGARPTSLGSENTKVK